MKRDYNLVHLDIKAQNILRVGENWKIADFGCVVETENPSNSFLFQGSDNYRSPEFEAILLQEEDYKVSDF